MTLQKLSEHIQLLTYTNKDEHAEIYLLQLFPGISLGINYVNIHRIIGDASEAASMDILRINYCFEGRCEVKLEDGRYVYVDNNALCIEDHDPQYNFHYPLGFYTGIQLFLDKKAIASHSTETFRLFGIHLAQLITHYSNTNQTFIQNASDSFARKASEIMVIWENENLSYLKKLEQIRFVLCQLLYYLGNNEAFNNDKPYNTSFLTHSQYLIAMDCERQLTADLSQKLTIDALAAQYKISPTSLKKFFMGVYGCNISEYTQTMRMKKAQNLLETTDDSIMQIAASVGYENQSKFSAVFKKHTGYAPLEYKRIYHLQRKEETT